MLYKWLCKIARHNSSARLVAICLKNLFSPTLLGYMDADTGDPGLEESRSVEELSNNEQDNDTEQEGDSNQLESDVDQYSDSDEDSGIVPEEDEVDGDDVEVKLRVQREKLKFEIEERVFEQRRKRGQEIMDGNQNIVPTVIEFCDTSDELVQEMTFECPGHYKMRDVQTLVRSYMEVEKSQPLTYSVDGEFVSPDDSLKILHMVHQKTDNHLHIRFKMAKMFWDYVESYIHQEHQC